MPITDPLAGSDWSESATVAGFAQSLPNAGLMRMADEELRQSGSLRVLDVGCGAGRTTKDRTTTAVKAIHSFRVADSSIYRRHSG